MFAIDEAPAAYKPIEDIIGPIAESVDIIDIMRPKSVSGRNRRIGDGAAHAAKKTYRPQIACLLSVVYNLHTTERVPCDSEDFDTVLQ